MTIQNKHIGCWVLLPLLGQVFRSVCLMVCLRIWKSVAFGLIQNRRMAPNSFLVLMPAEAPVARTFVLASVGAFRS